LVSAKEENTMYICFGYSEGDGALDHGVMFDGYNDYRGVFFDSESLLVKLGFIRPSGNRVEFSLEQIKYTNVSDQETNQPYFVNTYQSRGINVGYILVYNQDGFFRPFLGVSVGLYDRDATSHEENYKYGLATAYKGGIILSAENLELEFGAKIRNIRWNMTEDDYNKVLFEDGFVGYTSINLKF